MCVVQPPNRGPQRSFHDLLIPPRRYGRLRLDAAPQFPPPRSAAARAVTWLGGALLAGWMLAALYGAVILAGLIWRGS